MKPYLLIFMLLLCTVNLKSQTLYVTGGGSVVAQNTPVDIAGNAEITSGSTELSGATVSISSNFVTGQDVLGLNGAASGGIASSYNATTGILTLSGSASAADYQATMRKVTYTNTSATPTTAARVITFSLNAALPFTGNGHYFEFVSNTNISWTAANTAAIARTYFGLQGYLATITSAAENTFVYSKINAAGWLGGSDAASEGVWKWVGGPEAGTQFWQGNYIGGYAVGGMYTNWASGQPDNCCVGEHYLNFWSGDHWNDYPNVATGSISGYVVEYGGMSGDPVLHISGNVMVDFAPRVADLSVTSGSNIKWYDAAAGGNLLASTTPLVNGNHYYASQTVNGRESTARFDVTAHVNPPPQGSLSANGPLCASGTGTLTFTKTAGTGPYTVVYNDGTANRTVSNVTSGTAFNVFTNPVTSNTTYTLVSVQDANCTRSGGFTGGSATIMVNPNPTASAGSAMTAICQGGTSEALGGSYGGGATAAVWSAPSGTFSNNTGSTPGTATFTAASNSTSPITLTLTTSGGSCSTTTAAKQITVNPMPTPTFTTQPGATARLNNDVTYTTQSGKSNYAWTFPGTLNTDYSISSGGTTADYTVTLKYLTTGVKTVTINYPASGCVAESATSSTATTVSLTIGDDYEGGKIAYILVSGDPGYDANVPKGLIAATEEQSWNIAWITGGSTQTTLNGNTSTAYGTGQANTNAMIAQTGYTGGAAKVCDDYTNTDNGTGVYSDWYLPSKEELNKLYISRAAIGISGGARWSSSEDGSVSAWYHLFSNGNMLITNKYVQTFVRAVRTF